MESAVRILQTFPWCDTGGPLCGPGSAPPVVEPPATRSSKDLGKGQSRLPRSKADAPRQVPVTHPAEVYCPVREAGRGIDLAFSFFFASSFSISASACFMYSGISIPLA